MGAKSVIRDKVFSFTSIAIFIGTAGFLSAIATLFINVNSLISTKWFLFLCLIFLFLSSVLVKLALDLAREKNQTLRVYEHPVKMQSDQSILLIRPNPLFTPNCIVGGYLVNDEIEVFAFVGYVFHMQEKMIQIKITVLLETVITTTALFNSQSMNNIIIRPVIPFTIIDELGGVR
ncbi:MULTISPECIES: hypothetical protein [unclassified Pantoea]|uniref:hypothetical protein n=1 Tax=unclassified Pantoea TaxID=2630326 RepID=UPI001231FA49|nr:MULTISPECIES: hypothetical protein [unclassified Pantoea]KAA5924030.1 hypothetical protein F3I59_18855 [Pantoea sp. VH_8]KAA5930533.1 hypothetical protein F3I58_18940 [Pantoea sp. VH_4]